MRPRLKEYYENKIINELQKEFSLKNKLMGDLKEKMVEEIPKQLPKFSGPSMPLWFLDFLKN